MVASHSSGGDVSVVVLVITWVMDVRLMVMRANAGALVVAGYGSLYPAFKKPLVPYYESYCQGTR